jgi:hypothetical protein
MAITTVDGLIAGCKPMRYIAKNSAGSLVQARLFSPFYLAGIPSAAAAPTPGMSGVALTTYPGQIPFTNPPAGQNSYVARFSMACSGSSGATTLIDRLWHNSGISVTTFPGAQAVNSVTFPARDQNGSSDGVGVLLGLEVSGVTGTGTPTVTVTYTNSNGDTGRTGSVVVANSSSVGSFWSFPLASGDIGVQSVQSIAFSATWTSGTVHLVAYRPIMTFSVTATAATGFADALTGGLPRLYDDSVLSFLFFPGLTASNSGFFGGLTIAQG